MKLRLKLMAMLCSLFYVQHVNAQDFVNGGLEDVLTGSISQVPAGWEPVLYTDPVCLANFEHGDTPDLCDYTEPTAASGIIANPQSGISCITGSRSTTSGGDNVWQEGIQQTVAGFTAGETYSINFYQAVVKQSNMQDTAGSWIVYADDYEIGITDVSVSYLPYNSTSLVWDFRSLNFTATASTHTFKFLPMDDDLDVSAHPETMEALRMGIDSIYISAAPAPGVNFIAPNQCEGNEIDFVNTTALISEYESWVWEFGDGNTSTDENPSHLFEEPGTYDVLLIGNEIDSVMSTVTVYPSPLTHFEFIAGGISSEDGAIGSCLGSPILFNDLSTIEAPGSITSWNWDFGDGETATGENPAHTYETSATYTVVLNTISANGCVTSTSQTVVMTAGFNLDITTTEPTCFDVNNGEIVTIVTEETGALVFDIVDVEGTAVNIDNSNEANELGTGWYYITISDEEVCIKEDSIFLSEPDELTLTGTTTDELFGEDGTIDIDVTGGVPFYSFDWNNDGSGDFDDSEDLEGLAGGSYIVVVKDQNDCEATLEVIVETQLSIHENTEMMFSAYPNPTSDIINLSVNGDFDYQLITIDGKVLTEGKGKNKEVISLENFSKGIYSLVVKVGPNAYNTRVIKE